MAKSQGIPFGSRRAQHNELLRRLNRMRHEARGLAEWTVADAWEGEAISFAAWVMEVLEEIYYRAERLEDQGQLRLHE